VAAYDAGEQETLVRRRATAWPTGTVWSLVAAVMLLLSHNASLFYRPRR